MTIVLTTEGHAEVAGATAAGDDLWLDPAPLKEATGFEMKPEGLCKDDVCVPVPPEREAEFVRGDTVNAAAFWRHMGRPVLHDEAGETWMLGEAAQSRAEKLANLEAPDFTLPDVDGKLHSLSDYRGKKVFLTTWASW